MEAGHLVERGTFSEVQCPAAAGHTRDASQFKGTSITPSGMVKCFHSSCAGRKQEDFLLALPIKALRSIVSAFPMIVSEKPDAIYSPSLIAVAATVSLTEFDLLDEVYNHLSKTEVNVDRWMASIRQWRRR